MGHKVIINETDHSTEPVILKIDDKYFAYDNDPAYPETLVIYAQDAHVFRGTSEALLVTTFMDGSEYRIIPTKNLTYLDGIMMQKASVTYEDES